MIVYPYTFTYRHMHLQYISEYGNVARDTFVAWFIHVIVTIIIGTLAMVNVLQCFEQFVFVLHKYPTFYLTILLTVTSLFYGHIHDGQ